MPMLERGRFNISRRADIAASAVTVSEELVKTRLVGPAGRQLFVIEPASSDIDLREWAAASREFVHRKALEYGALLFRGFSRAAEDFGRFVDAIYPDLFEPDRRTYPVSTFTSNKRLLWHNDGNVDHSRWPSQIFLCCSQPASRGGETPIVDGRTLLKTIDPAILEQFSKKQLMYVRNYWEGLGHSWQRDFAVSTREELDQYCGANEIEQEWVNGDRLRLRWVRPAVRVHPQTGETVWFNLLFLWHPARFDAHEQQALTETFCEEDRPDNCYYADGSPIEKSILNELAAVHDELAISFSWQRDDIFLIDNMLFVHARNPFEGERKVRLAMRGPVHYRDCPALPPARQ